MLDIWLSEITVSWFIYFLKIISMPWSIFPALISHSNILQLSFDCRTNCNPIHELGLKVKIKPMRQGTHLRSNDNIYLGSLLRQIATKFLASSDTPSNNSSGKSRFALVMFRRVSWNPIFDHDLLSIHSLYVNKPDQCHLQRVKILSKVRKQQRQGSKYQQPRILAQGLEFQELKLMVGV